MVMNIKRNMRWKLTEYEFDKSISIFGLGIVILYAHKEQTERFYIQFKQNKLNKKGKKGKKF